MPSAAQLQQQAAAEGLALSPQQAECIVGQAQQFAQAATFFGSKGSVSFSEAQVVVGVLNQCYGSQQAFGQAFVGALQKQDPSLSAADATCLGQAIGSMSTDDVAYLLADQQSSMSTAAKSAMQKCLSSSSSTSNP